MIAHRSAPRPTIDSTAPTGSSRGVVWSLRVGHEEVAEDERGDHDRHVHEEHRAPPEVREQRAAGDRADADAERGHAGPDADRLGPLARASGTRW